MECKSCEAVVAYKDKLGRFHDTLEKCQKANREYRRQEAKQKFVKHLVENSAYYMLAYRTYSYSYGSPEDADHAKYAVFRFLDEPDNVKALMEAHEIYYKHLGDDL